MAHNIPGLQGLKCCIKYLASHPHKPIVYPSNYYDGSNVIKLTWSENQVEDYITQNSLEYNQDTNTYRIINRRQSVSGIIHTILGFSVLYKVQIQPDIASDYIDVEIIYI